VTLDWVTDTDESIGPIPSVSDFRPTKPQSPLPSLNPAPCSPDNPVMPAKPVRILTAPTSLRDIFVFAKPDRTSTKTTAASIAGETAPRANVAHFPTSLSKPGTDRHPKGLGEPPSPLAIPQLAPSPHTHDLSSNQRNHVTASKQRAPLEPTVTPPNGNPATETVPNGIALASTALTEPTPINLAPTAPILFDHRIATAPVDTFVNAPAVYAIPVHPPRDLSSLKSGTRNPWGSINHRRRRFHPPRDHPFSPAEQLRSPPKSHSNLHPRDPFSYSHSNLHPWSQLNPHFQPHSPAQTVHIFQTIQHPRGISPTKPKITKTIPILPRLSAEIQKPISVTQCLCGRNIPPIYNPNRSWRSAGTRRRFRRRVGTWRENWDRGCGRSHFSGGIQAWGPRFTERGYMDQLRWSRSGFGSDRR
jgi:hypothetical protein